ncbi:hypothetical protein B2H94_00345 [Clostridium sporogenes]|uniref:Holin n=2 Tax=Clostridium TaxID=1485 RepID=A0A1L3NG98_CLOSG|nr:MULTISPECIES: hypothetical protein [Clostridium]MBE6077381.1 hypothetical protein [Clostridium lundense]APH15155.1 hypothetical protein NPD5_1606 [Clostridium sporogenes]EDU38302.1 hypothetical protein CLOSPO_01164 [Clostridium sporogenes ATCC 15579]KIS22498.1 hypothetical protein N495_02465 [Clostridium botulinum B2 450]MBO0575479.1 hypothetical protein [Clostridium botulinum]
MKDLNCISPEELALLANLIALELSRGKNANELNVLGNLVAAVGTILLTIAAQKQNLENK